MVKDNLHVDELSDLLLREGRPGQRLDAEKRTNDFLYLQGQRFVGRRWSATDLWELMRDPLKQLVSAGQSASGLLPLIDSPLPDGHPDVDLTRRITDFLPSVVIGIAEASNSIAEHHMHFDRFEMVATGEMQVAQVIEEGQSPVVYAPINNSDDDAQNVLLLLSRGFRTS
ncbi:hypothetical protein FOL47_009779 [Perkinsus chesapeaki]|uniref:Uncharacterized protein n=1 Tax=Perkinsus chesapeaki TaxID=330153 RepID=A0A7J6L6I3_PERCH|nr:hypothetical protein FOL47_009779 [Perkinsus chesapeaki]